MRICEFETDQIQQLRDVRIAEEHAVDQARMARETEENRMRKLLHDGEAQTEIVRLHPSPHPVLTVCTTLIVLTCSDLAHCACCVPLCSLLSLSGDRALTRAECVFTLLALCALSGDRTLSCADCVFTVLAVHCAHCTCVLLPCLLCLLCSRPAP